MFDKYFKINMKSASQGIESIYKKNKLSSMDNNNFIDRPAGAY